MKKWVPFLFALIVFLVIHEGLHALVAMTFGEFLAVNLKAIGPEVTFKTPTHLRSGFQWVLISGTSNIGTILLGYLLLFLTKRFTRLSSTLLKSSIYYLTLFSLLIDPFNISFGPFIYGGDAIGIAVGSGINRYLIQLLFLLILIVNRELVAQKLLPAYSVTTRHIALRPWLMFTFNRNDAVSE